VREVGTQSRATFLTLAELQLAPRGIGEPLCWEREAVRVLRLERAATDPQIVGQAGLMIFDTRDWTPSTWAQAGSHAQPELGWALMRPHWGHGYATEAAAAIRDWARESRSINELVSLISPDNVRSPSASRRDSVRHPPKPSPPTYEAEDRRLETPPCPLTGGGSDVIPEHWPSERDGTWLDAFGGDEIPDRPALVVCEVFVDQPVLGRTTQHGKQLAAVEVG
jgi:hypothetical protein